jgi:MFS family permease
MNKNSKIKATKKEITENIWKIYLFKFFVEFMLITPVVVLFWQENGLNLTEIMFLQAIFALSTFVFEVPTGVIADKMSRRLSLILGAIFLILGTFVYGLSHNFYQFAFAEIIWGFSICFFSGADSAFIYDSLKEIKKEDDFKKIWGNISSFGYIGGGASAVLGGFIAVYSLRLNWFLMIIPFSLALIIGLTLREPKHFKKIGRKKSYFIHTKESFKEALTNKNLLFLALFFALVESMGRVSLWFYQPYMLQSGIAIGLFGIIWASFTVFAVSGSKFAHKIDKKLREKASLWLIVILMCISSILSGFYLAFLGIIFIFMQQFVRGFSSPISQDYTNKHLSSEKRATMLSIQSLISRFSFIFIGPLFGFLADKLTLANALIIEGVSFFILFSVLMFWKYRRDK